MHEFVDHFVIVMVPAGIAEFSISPIKKKNQAFGLWRFLLLDSVLQDDLATYTKFMTAEIQFHVYA